MHDKKLYGTVTVGTKGQVVIPADVREAFRIRSGDRMYVVGSEQGKWVGLVHEEQMRAMIAHVTDNIELFKQALNSPGQKDKE
jgi:AbrB family looped-hinge helix DNA binding protein